MSKTISMTFTEEEWISIIDGEFNDMDGFKGNVSERIRERLCRDGHDPEIRPIYLGISKECRRHCGQFYWRLDETRMSGPDHRFRYMSPTFKWEFYDTLEDVPYVEVREAYENASRGFRRE